MLPQIISFVQEHLFLVIPLFVLIVAYFFFEWQQKRRGPLTVSPQETVEFINRKDAVLLDIRPDSFFEKAHILNAVSCAPDILPNKLPARKEQAPYIVVCERGISAVKVAERLKAANMRDVYVLNGGMTAWIGADLPVVSGKKK